MSFHTVHSRKIQGENLYKKQQKCKKRVVSQRVLCVVFCNLLCYCLLFSKKMSPIYTQKNIKYT